MVTERRIPKDEVTTHLLKAIDNFRMCSDFSVDMLSKELLSVAREQLNFIIDRYDDLLLEDLETYCGDITDMLEIVLNAQISYFGDD